MIVGIDLGTTHSSISWFQGSFSDLSEEKWETIMIPSCVFFPRGNEAVVGELAKMAARQGKKGTYFSIKRMIGTTVLDERPPEEICSLILKECLFRAEKKTGKKFTEAVISVPALFNENQRQCVHQAASLIQLKIIQLISEPIAAAVGCWKNSSSMIVADLGGGTFDICLVKREENSFQVKAVGGEFFLGGDDFTGILFEKMKSELIELPLNYEETSRRIWFLAEEMKCKLSYEMIVETEFSYETSQQIIETQKFLVTQKELPGLFVSLTGKIQQVIEQFQKSIGNFTSDEILLSGGGTRMPLVREIIKNAFPDLNCRISEQWDLVSRGAAILGMNSERGTHLLQNILTMNVGVEVENGRFCPILCSGNSLPVSKTMKFQPLNHQAQLVEIEVYQGFSELVCDNLFVGKVEIPVKKHWKREDFVVEIYLEMDTSENLCGCVKISGENAEFPFLFQSENKLSGFQLACLHSRSQNTSLLEEWNPERDFFIRAEELMENGENLARELWKEQRRDSITLKSLLKKLKHYLDIRNENMVSSLIWVLTEKITEIIEKKRERKN